MDDAAYEALMARLNEAYPSQPAYTPADVKLQSGQITQQQGQDPVMLTNPRILQQGESNPIEFDQSGGVSQLGAMMNAGSLRGMLDMSGQDGMTPGYNAMGTMQLPEGYNASYRRSNEIGGLGDAQNAIMLAKQFGEPNTPSPSLSAGASRSGMSGPITYDLSASVPLTTGHNPEAPQFRLPSSREEQPMVPPSRRDQERQPSHQEVKGAATAGLSHSPSSHSTSANAGLKFNFADGGHVDAALHLLRQHFDEGGFLDSLRGMFSGPDYLSNGKEASFANMPTQDETNADFFKADRAMRLAQQASEPDQEIPQPLRRPVAEAAPRQQVAAPAPAPAPTPEPAPVNIPYAAPMRPMQMIDIASPPHLTEVPGFGQSLTISDLPRADTTPEISSRGLQNYTLPDAAFALPAPQAEISRAVSLAQNLAPAQQETIPSAADSLAAVEKFQNAGIFSGNEYDKAGEILAAHNRAMFDSIPVEEALRLNRAAGPMMINQGMPREERPAVQPLAYTAAPAPAPAQAAIAAAMPAGDKLTDRAAAQPGMTDLTPQQTDYIIRTIAAESSGNPEESQGIANVIMNRINSGRFGPTPEHVLFSKNQFEPWSNKSLANYPLKIKPDSDRYQAAAGALDAALQGEDNTGGATYFWGPGSQYARGRNTPSWANKFPDYTDIGATRFHREGRADGGETNGDKNMTHRHIIDHALHVLRRHFDGSDGSYVDPMGNVAYGDNTDYRDVPGYKAIEEASIGAGKAGAAIGEPLRKGTENYIGNVNEALQSANEYARQGLENTVSDKGPLYNVSGPLQYGLGVGGMFAAPLTGAIKSGEQAATELTGNPEIGSRFGAVAGVMDPTHVGALKAAPELATILGKTSQTVSEASPYAAMAAIPGMRGKITKATDLPSIRDLPVDDAIEIARREQHLIPTEAGNPNSGFVGGPRDIENKRQLNQLRKNFDTYIGADPRGGDWYDRYRAAVNSVTGGDPTANAWMAAQEGQWSAGVSPQSELAFALKENNASIAGMPVKAARPAQFEAHNRAIEMQDPNEMQLGKKTGEYARLINPDQFTQPGATGVNDFRHARNFNYTEAGGDAQRAALTGTQHSFLDYETALAVDRANKANLAGRSNWTGEQLQAAPWVRQKALDILDQRPAILDRRMTEQLALAKTNGMQGEDATNFASQRARELAYEDAFQDANSTIGDAFDKHTAFATHEAQPGSVTQHLPGSVGASQEERNAFAADPRSSWAFAPGNRDAIYSGLGIPGTGVSMRVRPTNQMQGMYTTPSGVLETNPGEVARPLVAFQSGEAKSVAPADRSLLNAGEATRAYIDAQNAGAWHKPWAGGAPKLSNSYFLPMDRPATVDELVKMREGLAPHGLNDIVDTGQGITATSFYPGAPELSRDARAQVERAIELARPEGSTGAQRVKIQPGVDTGYLSYEDEFANPGSGDATRALLKQVNQTPGIRQAFNLNADIPQKALNNLARDEEWANKWGATRDDIQRSRRIIGEGPGWIDRLETALKNGAVLPAIGAALLAPLVGRQDNGG